MAANEQELLEKITEIDQQLVALGEEMQSCEKQARHCEAEARRFDKQRLEAKDKLMRLQALKGSLGTQRYVESAQSAAQKAKASAEATAADMQQKAAAAKTEQDAVLVRLLEKEKQLDAALARAIAPVAEPDPTV